MEFIRSVADIAHQYHLIYPVKATNLYGYVSNMVVPHTHTG